MVGENMLNSKMNAVAYELGKNMIMTLPDGYQKIVFDVVPLKQIVLQMMVECCEYAFGQKAEKTSLWAFMKDQSIQSFNETEIEDNFRMRMQRAANNRNKQMAALSSFVLKNSKMHLPEIVYEKEDDHYSINSLDYYRMCQQDDVYLWKVVLNRQFLTNKFYNDDFRNCSLNYDAAVKKMKNDFANEEDKEKKIVNGLAFFGMEFDLYFDFLYEIVVAMEANGIKSIPDMSSRITAFCYQPTIKSALAYFENWPFLAELTTSSRSINIRRKFVSDIAILPVGDDYEFRQALYLETLFLSTFYQAASIYENLPLRKWFLQNADYDDIICVLTEYGVFDAFVDDKYWTNKRIRYAKEIYGAMTFDYKKTS